MPRPCERLLEARLRLCAVELIGLDALAPQRGDGFGRPRRSARLDPGLALNEPPGAIAEPEEENSHAQGLHIRECPIPFSLGEKVSGGARRMRA